MVSKKEFSKIATSFLYKSEATSGSKYATEINNIKNDNSLVRKFYRNVISSDKVRRLVALINIINLAVFYYSVRLIVGFVFFKRGDVLRTTLSTEITDLPFQDFHFDDVYNQTDKEWHINFFFSRFPEEPGIFLNVMNPQFVSTPSHIFVLDTGLGIFFGAVNIITGESGITLSHQCGCEDVESSGAMDGYQSTGTEVKKCYAYDTDPFCDSFCLLPNTETFGDRSLFVPFDNSFHGIQCSTMRKYKIRNSLGFGQTVLHQTVVNSKISSDNKTISYETEVTGTHDYSNMNELFPWQIILSIWFLGSVLYSATCRLAVVKILFAGVKLKDSKLNVIADLVGSLITTPSINSATLIFFIVIGGHHYFWILASPYGMHVEGFIHLAVQLSSFAAIILSPVSSILGRNWVVSGSIMVYSSIGLLILMQNFMKTSAMQQVRALGVVFMKTCTIFAYNINGGSQPSIPFDCNVVSEAGVSGFEVFTYVMLRPLALLLAIIVVLEIIESVIRKVLDRFRDQSKRQTVVHSKIKLKKVSHFEKCLFYKGQSVSRWCRWWSAPLETQFGIFYTISTMVENNVILWGPILIDLTLLPIFVLLSWVHGQGKVVAFAIQNGLYSGVLMEDHILAATKENGRSLSKYVNEYDYSLNQGVNPTPVK